MHRAGNGYETCEYKEWNHPCREMKEKSTHASAGEECAGDRNMSNVTLSASARKLGPARYRNRIDGRAPSRQRHNLAALLDEETQETRFRNVAAGSGIGWRCIHKPSIQAGEVVQSGRQKLSYLNTLVMLSVRLKSARTSQCRIAKEMPAGFRYFER